MLRETLKAERRDASGKTPVARRLRKSGRIPGVLYRAGDSLPFDCDTLEAAAVLRHGANIVDLAVGEKSYIAVIKDHQIHPVRSTLQHLDLQEVRMDERVKLTVPLVMVGDSVGVKAGGVLTQSVHELNIECTPVNIPDVVEIDISAVEVGEALHLSDVTAPDGVLFLDSDETLVMAISVPRAVVEEAPAEGAEGEEGAEGAAAEAPAAAEGGDAAPAADS
jgi:large subunit ribosomal protein L25